MLTCWKKIVTSDETFFLLVKYNSRNKTMKLSYDRKSLSPLLTLPLRYHKKNPSLHFLKQHKQWLLNIHRNYPKKIPFNVNNTFPLLDKKITITACQHGCQAKQLPCLINNCLYISPAHNVNADLKIKNFLKNCAKKKLTKTVNHYCELLDVNVAKITVKETSSQWGSCSIKGAMSFSWRLVFCPNDVLSSVVAHEVAHLLHMNHSKQFWQTVEKIDPQHKTHSQWLKNNTNFLYSIGQRDDLLPLKYETVFID